MIDFPLMVQIELCAVESIHPESNKFATGVDNKATDD